MYASALTKVKQTAAKQLASYRKSKALLASHTLKAQERAQLARWTQAIEGARAILHDAMPEKERAMTRLFGLDAPTPRHLRAHTRLIRLSMDMNVSESTLYKWRNEILLLVMGAAIETGAVSPFGLRAAAGTGCGGETKQRDD